MTFIDPDTADTLGWHKQAVCVDHDPALWFSDNPNTTDYAVRVCHSCPVILACLGWAVSTRQSYGIWGGVDFSAATKPWHAKKQRARSNDEQ